MTLAPIYRHQNDKSAAGSGKVCAGAVDFIISKVAITVTAKVDQTTSGSGGLQVPVNLATLDGSVGVSRALNDTITTKLSIFPLTAAADAEIEDESLKKSALLTHHERPQSFADRQSPTRSTSFGGILSQLLTPHRASILAKVNRTKIRFNGPSAFPTKLKGAASLPSSYFQ
ncbi:hypothetical protein ELI36_32935 [Rhizobium ruizarguesonis]|uniref:hypothetical protein n=1 Tax=Rhizobium ruizarguesonis TaxID=2081791 RepID=UPI001031FB93|nr:hypothetical protein [Rhizobium ruizarguesonis]TAV21347.1 hypothetical protein ELI36_32935 [Rhizobium ruizarguesonis]